MFDWDDGNIAHIAEHDVSPSEVEEAVVGKSIFLNYETRSGEDRFNLIGETLTGRVLVIVVTPRHALTRVVTAFPANRAYRAHYETERSDRHGEGEEDPS